MPNAIEVGEIGEWLHVLERIEHFFRGGVAGTGEEEGASVAQDGFADLQSPTFGSGRGDALPDLRDGDFEKPVRIETGRFVAGANDKEKTRNVADKRGHTEPVVFER